MLGWVVLLVCAGLLRGIWGEFFVICANQSLLSQHAESLHEGPSANRLRDIAKKYSMVIVYGVMVDNGGKVQNGASIMDSTGTVCEPYTAVP